jgi:succinate dehydrogenase / fumarate reductase iron-sulfur subunit
LNNNENKIEDKIKLKVYRENRGQNSKSYYDSFEVPYKRWTTVLDALLYVKGYIDPSLAIRYSCRMASCGSCGMKINGIPRLACYTKISELETSTIECEPLGNFPIIRDLVTAAEEKTYSYYQSPQDVDKYLQFSYCIKCGLCYSACPTVGTDLRFPGPQALAQLYRYFADTRDESKNRLNIVDDRHGIWRCHFAGSCSKVCPKGVDPALGIQLLRSYMLGVSKNNKKQAEKIEVNLD